MKTFSAPLAALENVSFIYRDNALPALRNLDFELKPGEMVGIIGASGAGKSTLIKCLNRLVPGFEHGVFSGRALLNGQPLDAARTCELAPRVGMVFQDFEAQLFSTNVRLEVAFAMQQAGMAREVIKARIGPALAAVGLRGFENRDPTSLSGGEKQRLALASVLALRPEVLLFDEPTTDLDPDGRAEVLQLIHRLRAEGLALIVIEHELEELRAADRLIVMRAGEIVAQGPPTRVLPQLDLLESCGIRPPDLNRAFAMLGLADHPATLDDAEAQLRKLLSITHNPILTRNPAQPVILSEASPRAKGRPSLRGAVTIKSKDLHQAMRDECSSATTAPTPLVETCGLTFSYVGKSAALTQINLTIAAGEFLALVGHNGSGKTTLAKQIAGLLKPASGAVLIDGRDRATLSAAANARAVGYVFQNPDHQIFAATIEDEVAFGPRNFGLLPDQIALRVDEVLRAVGLDAMRERDPFLLSKGERQRLAVASVIALRPRLLIFDEPTTGLDYREQRCMMELIAALNRDGLAILIITHTPWLVAEYARRVVLMARSAVRFDGSVREFFAEKLLRDSAFRPPEITRLAQRLGFSALTVDEFVATLRASDA